MPWYHIKIDSLGIVNVSDLRQALSENQQDLELHFCYGTVTRKEDTIVVDADTKYNKIYFLTLEKHPVLDSLSNKIHIEFLRC